MVQYWSYNASNQTTVCVTPNLYNAGETIDVWDTGNQNAWYQYETVLNNDLQTTLQDVWWRSGDTGVYNYDPGSGQIYQQYIFHQDGTSASIHSDIFGMTNATTETVNFNVAHQGVVQVIDYRGGDSVMSLYDTATNKVATSIDVQTNGNVTMG